jgi:hypothetical protein
VPCITAVLRVSAELQTVSDGSTSRVEARHNQAMLNSFRRSRLRAQVRALAWSTFLASGVACDSRGSLATNSLAPPDSASTPIGPAPTDSGPGGPGTVPGESGPVDTLPVDTLPVDTLPVDTLPSPSEPPPGPNPVPPTQAGIPFGPFDLWHTSYSFPAWGPAPFTMSSNADAPDSIIIRINAARALGHKLILGMTSGEHSRYITNGKFDWDKWKARQDRYNTPAIKEAVAAAVADGTVLMNNMMDEPQHSTWGGVMTKPLIDRMAAYVKNIFPTLLEGVSVRWDWRPDERYRVLDFIVNQYVARYGSVTDWRDQALAAAKQNGVAFVFGLNPINGGTRVRGCPLGPTGGPGTYGGNCRMTAAQVREFGSTLGVAGCALILWRYNEAFMSRADNQQAFKDVAAKLATRQSSPCRRS